MTNNNPNHLTGSIVALITPMHADGTVDFASLRRLIDWHIEQGTDCISVTGTTGESPTITVQEHIEVIRVTVEHSNNRVPIMAGCGANSTHEAINLAKHAQKYGATYQLQVVPYYNKPTQLGLKNHFTSIAEETGDLPIVLYNVPGRTITNLENETIFELASIKGIIAIKEASGDLVKSQDLLNRAPKDFLIFSGDDLTAVFLMLAGGHGNISVTANVAPKLMHQLCKYAIAGDVKQAMSIQQQLFELHTSLFIQSNPIPVKYAMHQLGLSQQYIRSPLTELNESYCNIVKQAIANAKISI